ncbi:hypothetical protein [Streptomyces litchfieldiae]|uniref:Magnesium chelatase n=1 Tax=Streptomyces litchfieldiae TaxID=3075543 RepID=A0ABU2MQH1_9ACTN|nr:hypothetical protein [Streptomyces sp. DSM 44938]MDT0343877.1 hypothetical protein [Streptomyces sp. DSM 44938]
MMSSPSPAADDDPLARVLTVVGCVAAEPRLGGVLFFDLEPALLPLLGEVLAERLDPAPGPVVTLGSWTTAEDLWLRTGLTDGEFAVLPGVLVEDAQGPPPVVVVPDLGHAGLVVTQAAVTLLDADAASAELFGHSLRWRPRARWLAAVSRAGARQLSPHLLDRFPARVNAAGAYEGLLALREESAPDDPALLRSVAPAPAPARRAGGLPRLGPEAAREVVSLMPASGSRRRDLALARTARALAALDGPAEAVGVDHVRRAAALLGVRPPAVPPAPAPAADVSEPPPAPEPPPQPAQPPGPSPAGPVRALPVTEPGPAVPLETAPAPAGHDPRSPYPEDDPQALPRFGSLRAPRPSRHRTGLLRGHPAGLRPARELRDLALVPSLVEAAKFQRIRRPAAAGPGRGGLIVSPGDLRQYRRRPDSGRALLLVLDHSCRTGWDWAPALAPYLRWGYYSNAAVSVVEFGHRDAAAELAAERYRADSLLDPRILVSLNRAPGLASPLAHALDLAVNELRRMLRRGRASFDEVVLVVVTDGRGNVPLDASVRGETPANVSRQGVSDAQRVAAAVRTVPRARPVVISPDTEFHPELAFDLAEAMGGTLVGMPRGRP